MNPIDSDLKVISQEELSKAVEDELKKESVELTVAELLNVQSKPSS